MKRTWVLLLTASVLCATWACGLGSARADATLNPFRTPASGDRPLSWMPMRPARQLSQATTSPAAVSAPAEAHAPEAAAGKACVTDQDCPAGTICEDKACRAFERPLNILLFRKEGGFTAF